MAYKYLDLIPRELLEKKNLEDILAFISMLKIPEYIKKYILKEVCDYLELKCNKKHYIRIAPTYYQIR